jgi:hypothetical protein
MNGVLRVNISIEKMSGPPLSLEEIGELLRDEINGTELWLDQTRYSLVVTTIQHTVTQND